MRLVIQRVQAASVYINGREHASINKGLMILAGIEHEDTREDAEWLAGKTALLRIFDDEQGVMNLSVTDISGDILVVSQFTLHASTRKGNRPSYIRAARPELAQLLYEHFIALLEEKTGREVKSGVFGSRMQISLINDGPVTIIIDSKLRE
jgi:D-tyrosyl-tRNA(Tyr) deacylase